VSSHAQLTANRANAQHSTGPKTEAGKQHSSQNALKHGLTAATPLVRDDEREAYAEFSRDLYTRILPAGALEDDLFAKLLHASWCLRRIRRLEEDLFERDEDPFTDPEAERKMAAYARHTARFERIYRNALRDLRQLQTDRNLLADYSKSAPVTLTVLTDIVKLIKQTQKEPKSTPAPPLEVDDPGPSEAEFEDFIAAHHKS